MRQKNALLSVYNKEGIVEFAQQLKDMGWKIFASGGTAIKLTEAGIEVTDVAELIGGGAILGHKVVTLSREVFAGILANTLDQKDMSDMEKLNLPIIDLVCVDCYPLTEEIAKEASSIESVTEKTDIGGPTMLRAAAKARRIVIANATDRQTVIDWLKQDEPFSDKFRLSLAAKAERYVANYVLASAEYLEAQVA